MARKRSLEIQKSVEQDKYARNQHKTFVHFGETATKRLLRQKALDLSMRKGGNYYTNPAALYYKWVTLQQIGLPADLLQHILDFLADVSRAHLFSAIFMLDIYPSVTFETIDLVVQTGWACKWLHYFSNVSGLVYSISLSSLVLPLDDGETALGHAIEAWRSLTCSFGLKNVPWRFLLNVRGVDEDFLTKHPLPECYKELEFEYEEGSKRSKVEMLSEFIFDYFRHNFLGCRVLFTKIDVDYFSNASTIYSEIYYEGKPKAEATNPNFAGAWKM